MDGANALRVLICYYGYKRLSVHLSIFLLGCLLAQPGAVPHLTRFFKGSDGWPKLVLLGVAVVVPLSVVVFPSGDSSGIMCNNTATAFCLDPNIWQLFLCCPNMSACTLLSLDSWIVQVVGEAPQLKAGSHFHLSVHCDCLKVSCTFNVA